MPNSPKIFRNVSGNLQIERNSQENVPCQRISHYDTVSWGRPLNLMPFQDTKAMQNIV